MIPTFARRCACALLLAAAGTAHAETAPRPDPLAFSLYAEFAKSDGNLFFSPFSIESALAMAAEGARGETARELAAVLGAPADGLAGVHARIGGLAARLATKPTPPGTLKRLEALRRELAAARDALEDPEAGRDYARRTERVNEIATEVDALYAQVSPYEFRAANAVWVDRAFELARPWLDAIARHYGAGNVKRLDFAHDVERGRVAINDWVEERTNARIRDLLAPGSLDSSTRLVLTNAVWFLGEWLEPFDERRSSQGMFQLRDGTTTTATLMRGRRHEGVRYAAFNADGSPFATPRMLRPEALETTQKYPVDGFQALELPYRGDALSMLVLLPTRPDGLASLEALLTPAHVAEWTSELAQRDVDVVLPKFRLESGFELAPVLQRLGARRAFIDPEQRDGADFTGISADGDLFIGAVVHKAFVEVTEQGTEAAAATAVTIETTVAMSELVEFTPVFRADRPFVFLIRDRASSSVIFLGRLERPR